MNFFKKFFGRRVKITDEIIDKYEIERKKYSGRKAFVDDLKAFVRWVDAEKMAFFYVGDAIKWLEERKVKAIERDEKHKGNVPSDEPIIIENVIGILKGQERFGDDVIGNVKKIITVADIKHNEHLEWVIREIQVDLEKIRMLICVDNPDKRRWAQAGDILIPMFENYFMRCLKHEILTHTKPAEAEIDYAKIEFGDEIEFSDLRIETREERAMREKRKKNE